MLLFTLRGFPPATGYFSFETPPAIGRGELTRSELETSRADGLVTSVLSVLP